MKKFNLDEFKIEPKHILVTHTTEPYYEVYREILLEIDYGRYVVIEGGHCSCYGMDEVEWDAVEYTWDELKKLADAPYNEGSEFWKMVRIQIYN